MNENMANQVKTTPQKSWDCVYICTRQKCTQSTTYIDMANALSKYDRTLIEKDEIIIFVNRLVSIIAMS